MTAALDYDTLEIIGSAFRDATRRDVKEPLSEDLLVLCRRLEEVDDGRADKGGASGDARRNGVRSPAMADD